MRNGTSDVAAHSPASSGQGEPRIDLSLCEHQQHEHGHRLVPAGPPRLRPRVKTRANAFVTEFHPVQWTQGLPGCGPLALDAVGKPCAAHR